MKRIAAILLMLVFADAAPAQDRPAPRQPAPPAVRFLPVEVWLDSGDRPLAAWQIEFTSESDDVKIVGVEGGAHAAFTTPPYYDPAALSRGRIVLAAFNTGKGLPSGKTRVATLHLQVRGGARPEWSARVAAAATADGARIDAQAEVREGRGSARD